MRRWRLSRVRISLLTLVWVTVIWVSLWGDWSVGNVLAGVALGLLIPALLPLPRVFFHGSVRPIGVLQLLGRFAVDLVVASVQVSKVALKPAHRPHGAVVAVMTRADSDLYLTLTSEITTLIPGSVVVEALRTNGMMYVHVLDLELAGGVEEVRRSVLAVEERVLRAFGSDEDLRRIRSEAAR